VVIGRVGMNGVGGILRETKSTLIEPPRSIFHKATIFDTFLIRDSDCPLKRLLGVRTPRVFGGNVYLSAVKNFTRLRAPTKAGVMTLSG
jgi:hypothetical protein